MIKKVAILLTLIITLLHLNLGHATVVEPLDSAENDSSSSTYDVKSTSFTDKNIKIAYPQLIDINDNQIQNTINTIIKNEALKGLNYYSLENSDKLTLDIDYTITYQSDHLLSIIYSGIGMVEGAAHPNHLFYTTNVNIGNGEKFRLKDLIDIDETFIEKFKDRSIAKNPLHKGVLSQYENKALLKMLINADSLVNIGTDLQFDTFSYFTMDSLGISISVSHALGGHAEFEIPYKYITKDNLAGTRYH